MKMKQKKIKIFIGCLVILFLLFFIFYINQENGSNENYVRDYEAVDDDYEVSLPSEEITSGEDLLIIEDITPVLE